MAVYIIKRTFYACITPESRAYPCFSDVVHSTKWRKDIMGGKTLNVVQVNLKMERKNTVLSKSAWIPDTNCGVTRTKVDNVFKKL